MTMTFPRKAFNSDNSSSDENFDCLRKKNIQEFYIQFPFKKWISIIKQIIGENENNINYDSGKKYQNTVNKVMLEDIFFGHNFKYENDENKLEFNSDFIVENIQYGELMKILEERKYMFFFENISFKDDNKNVTIVGEICKNLKFKKEKQIRKYCEELSKNQKKDFIFMLIFDHNYSDLFIDTHKFKNLKSIEKKNIPVIYGYIPRLYKEECYYYYNKYADEKDKINYKKYIQKFYSVTGYDELVNKTEKSEEEKNELKKKYEFTIQEITKKYDEEKKKMQEELIKKEEEYKKKMQEEFKTKEVELKKKEEQLKKIEEQLLKKKEEDSKK